MFFRKPDYRRFEYSPRYYRPEDDRGELLKERLRHGRTTGRRKPRSPFLWAIVIIVLFYAYLYLSGSLH